MEVKMNQDWKNEYFKELLLLAKGRNENGTEIQQEEWIIRWNDLMELKRKHLPSSLLRFRPIQDDNDLKIRKSEIDGVLYFCDVRKQNDSFDSSLLALDNSVHDSVVRAVIENVKNSGYIVCFNDCTTDNDCTADWIATLPMWEFYANGHKGCCMKYDNVSLWPTEWQDALFPVRYTGFQDFLNEFRIDDFESDSWEYRWYAFYKFVMTNKFFSWSNEKEWRIILDKNLLQKLSKKFDKNIRIYPTDPNFYEQGFSLFKIQEKPYQEICFEQLLAKNEAGELGIINNSNNSNHDQNGEPMFRGISLRCLKPSQIILGKKMINDYREKIMKYCRSHQDVAIRNIRLSDITFEYNQIKLRELNNSMCTTAVENETIDILKGGAYLEGVKKTIIILVNKNLLSISDAAKELGICEKDFKLLMEQQ